MQIRKLLLGCCLIGPLGLLAQTPPYTLGADKKLNQFNIERWTPEEGLPTNSLLHLYQSSDGYIWLSGYGGIIRFDGQNFTSYNKKNT